MYRWEIQERDTMRLFYVFIVFHIAVSTITVMGHGLSFITVFAAPAIFAFWLTFNPVIAFALFGLIWLYQIDTDC
tara:strand:+ start:67 stop:291 length:225 start_codon:yes stop_codon:yes gene_type:complete